MSGPTREQVADLLASWNLHVDALTDQVMGLLAETQPKVLATGYLRDYYLSDDDKPEVILVIEDAADGWTRGTRVAVVLAEGTADSTEEPT